MEPKKKKKIETSVAILENINSREEYDILIKSGTLPASLDTPERLMAVLATGKELGMPPMVAINNINLIAGRTVVSSAMMGALLKERGMEYAWTKDHFVEESGRITTELAVDYLSKLTGKVKTVTFDVSWGQFVKAGYTTKDNWKKMPKEMMRARCMSGAIRANFPEIMLGMYFDIDLVDAKDTGHEMEVNEEGHVTIIASNGTEVESNDNPQED